MSTIRNLLILLIMLPVTVFARYNGNLVCKTSFSPASPALLQSFTHVDIEFTYSIIDPAGALIFFTPVSGGTTNKNYVTSGSQEYYGEGTDKAFFTLSGSGGKVDSILVEITDLNIEKIQYSYYIPVNYKFGNTGVSGIVSKIGPASFLFNEVIPFNFDYMTTEPNGVQIVFVPYTHGKPTANFSTTNSPTVTGSGKSNSSFTVTKGNNVAIDSVRTVIIKAGTTDTLASCFTPTKYYFGSAALSLGTLPTDPSILTPLNKNISISYTFRALTRAYYKILITPMTQGAASKNFASSSPVQVMKGDQATSTYTITAGNTNVDHLKVQILSDDQTTVILEYTVPVYNTFGYITIYDVNFCPQGPAAMADKQFVEYSYKYKTLADTGNFLVFPLPGTPDNKIFDYATNGSDYYPGGSGSIDGYFGVLSGNKHVDKMNFQVTDTNGTVLLEYIFPMEYYFAEKTITANPSSATSKFNLNVKSYPVPFSEENNLTFNLPEGQQMSIVLINALGQEITSVYKGYLGSGPQEFTILGSKLMSGIYYYAISGENFRTMEKIVVQK